MANTQNSKVFGAVRRKGFAGYDVVGNTVIVKFSRDEKLKDKKKFAYKLFETNKNYKTILEKSGKFSGRLRTQETKFLAGINTNEALHKENGCMFKLNVDTCYFSPRLSTERKDIAEQVKKGESVLVMFGGVAPFAIVIAKKSKARRVVSLELGRECSKYALENVKRNKLQNVEIIQGDVRKVKLKEKYDRIVMARPNLKDSFLDVAFPLIKKGGFIHYYGFYEEDDKNKMLEMINSEAKSAKKKIKILRVKKAGEIGNRKFRFRVDLRVN